MWIHIVMTSLTCPDMLKKMSTLMPRSRRKFRDGLNPDIQLPLSVHDFADFSTLVNKAIVYETNLGKQKEALKCNKEVASSSGSSGQKRKFWVPHNVYHKATPAQRPSYAAPRPPPAPRQPRIQNAPSTATAPQPNSDSGLCFKCGRPGHRAAEC